jgi:hypothetical protein
MKRIGGRTGAFFHRGMSDLSAHVVVHIQLTCESMMALTRPRGITSSVSIRTQTLWYGCNFLVLFKFHTVLYISWPLHKINLFQPFKFRKWIDMEKPRCGRRKYP